MVDDLTDKFETVRQLNKKAADEENELLMGQMSGSKVGKIELRNGISQETQKKRAEKEREKKDLKEYLSAKILNDYLRELEKEIQSLEASFRKRDGDEWREKLALRILDADDIPERRKDETIEAYRERIELLLIDQMLNADGSIKSEYTSDPELSDYAEWAQKKNHFSQGIALARRVENGEEIEPHEVGNTELVVFVDRALANGSDAQGGAKDLRDNSQDVKFQQEQSMARNAFLMPD